MSGQQRVSQGPLDVYVGRVPGGLSGHGPRVWGHGPAALFVQPLCRQFLHNHCRKGRRCRFCHAEALSLRTADVVHVFGHAAGGLEPSQPLVVVAASASAVNVACTCLCLFPLMSVLDLPLLSHCLSRVTICFLSNGMSASCLACPPA